MITTARDFFFTILFALSLPACQSAGLGSPRERGPGDTLTASPTTSTGSCDHLAPDHNGGCVGAPLNDADACNDNPDPLVCIDGGCTYAEMVDGLRSMDACGPAPNGFGAMVQLGVCGDYAIIDIQHWGLGSEEIRFFDPISHNLVGIQTHSDTTSYCGGTSFVTNHGDVPHCQPVICETLCKADHFTCGH